MIFIDPASNASVLLTAANRMRSRTPDKDTVPPKIELSAMLLIPKTPLQTQ